MSKHTPGPWMVASDRASPPEVIAPGLHDICVMSGASSNSGVMADARLIAAAPQQHDALLAVLHAPGFDALDDATKNAVRAAIAKGTGSAQC